MCLLCKLDYAVFFRTIHGHSWSNLVERVILILNLALRGVSLARAAMDTVNERIMKRWSGLAETTAAAENSVNFKQKNLTGIDAVIKPLESRFKPFRSLPSTTADAFRNFGQKVFYIDPTIDVKKLNKLGLKNMLHYMTLSNAVALYWLISSPFKTVPTVHAVNAVQWSYFQKFLNLLWVKSSHC